MKILISGGTGFIGKEIISNFREDVIYVLTRGSEEKKGNVNYVKWDPTTMDWWSKVEKPDFIINLAGRSIGEGRWNETTKKELLDSRILSTRAVVNYANKMEVKRIFNASAVGYYGDRGNEILVEESNPGSDFLAKLAFEWEREARKFQGELVILRFGVVLGRNSPLMKNLMRGINTHFSKRLGTGRQWYSWIYVSEIPEIIKFILNRNLFGEFNVTTPEPMQNEDFMRVLAEVTGKKQYFGIPSFILRIMLGELADFLVLSSQRAVPKKLLDNNYSFKFGSLREALQASL